jgi:hypothetical protein
VPACHRLFIESVWDQFAVLIPEHIDTHPLGCHNPRIPDRTVFDKLVQVPVLILLVHATASGNRLHPTPDALAEPSGPFRRHRPVHSDLLLFTPA